VRRDHAVACAMYAILLFVVGKNGKWKKVRTQAKAS